MENIKLSTINVDDRVREAINESMLIYCNKLARGKISVGLEATFQHELALILKDVLEQKTLTNNERFSLTLEQNMPINGRNNYVDIVIHYDFNSTRTEYLIELKFKKITDSAPDLGVVETYFDLYNLDLLHNTGNIKNCYVIFLTDLKTYSNAPKGTGTRFELPMHDGAKIQGGSNYMPLGKTARNKIIKQFGSSFAGFKFTKDMVFNYCHFNVKQSDYWFFIEEI